MLSIEFDTKRYTLCISGEGNLCRSDIEEYSRLTKYIMIIGERVKCTNASNLFNGFCKLIGIDGYIDTSLCTKFDSMYEGCESLVQPVVGLDVSNGRDFRNMHANNKSLREIHYNLRRGVFFKNMLYGCSILTNVDGVVIPSKDINITNIDYLKRKLLNKEVV